MRLKGGILDTTQLIPDRFICSTVARATLKDWKDSYIRCDIQSSQERLENNSFILAIYLSSFQASLPFLSKVIKTFDSLKRSIQDLFDRNFLRFNFRSLIKASISSGSRGVLSGQNFLRAT